jgi:hypothetical protein
VSWIRNEYFISSRKCSHFRFGVSISRLAQKRTQVSIVKCPLFLSDCNQNWNVVTNVGKTPKYQIQWRSVQLYSSYLHCLHPVLYHYWWYLAVNTTIKINQSNYSHWFYLIVATCFGPHLGQSSGSLIKYVSCYWTVLKKYFQLRDGLTYYIIVMSSAHMDPCRTIQ